jgi:membrane protein implicated in regulation of membrane protease activity
VGVWTIWLVAAVILGIVQTRRGGFLFAPLALGAVLAAVVSLLGVSALLSAIAFIAAAAIVFATLKPDTGGRRRTLPAIRAGAGALVGRPAVVLERIANGEGVGCVRIDGGEVWTARSAEEGAVIDAGERVEVVEIRGATAVVTN